MKLRRDKPGGPSTADTSKRLAAKQGRSYESDRSVDGSAGDIGNLQYGSSTPGTMARTTKFASSLGLFPSNLFDSDADTVNTNQTSHSTRLGIARRKIGGKSKNCDDTSIGSSISHRIGINRPNYEISEDALPLPLPRKGSSPTPNLVDADSTESADGDQWQSQVLQESNPPRETLDHASAPEAIACQQAADGQYIVNSPRRGGSPDSGTKQSLQFNKDGMSTKMNHDSKFMKTLPNVIRTSENKNAEAFKIFLLLIQPQSKMFEIIQAFYTPFITTVDDLLEMIPVNATEPALGSQSYVGLCRPDSGEELRVDMMLNSVTGDSNGTQKSRIEIFVAIPEGGYNGIFCAKIARPILANSRVAKLLSRSDPLVPDRNSSRQHSKRHRKKISSKKISALSIDTVHEEECSTINDESTASTLDSLQKKEQRRRERDIYRREQDKVRKAIQHAAEKAASSNAGIKESDLSASSIPLLEDSSREIWKTTMNLRSRSTLRRGPSVGDSSSILSCDQSMESSIVDNSIASMSMDGSLSLTASCSESLHGFKRIPRRRTRRRHAKKQRNSHLTRMAPVILVAMVTRYVMVTSGQQGSVNGNAVDEIFGFQDATICAFLFYIFCKMQLYLQGDENPMNHPVYRLLNMGWNSFKRLAKKARK
eukprot:CAMPEP_0194212926 /NCGR_PEP_ID=MMETSP0156-20130528/13104_1 /TAXON_ID=33649 /ORGANISM="Thalassionema nitzschioides, Strain L26-B" /LENGTH=651 /DNA_ID=CAMNT_0038940833 /DNA_START=196 /DNA_END=2151 /DNA_ORIENTATION=+